MVGAGSAELGEARGVGGVNEAEDFLVVLNGADETLLLRNLAAQPWQDLREGIAALFF